MRHYPYNRIVALHLIGSQRLKLYLQISASVQVKLEWHSGFVSDRIRLVERSTISRTGEPTVVARKFYSQEVNGANSDMGYGAKTCIEPLRYLVFSSKLFAK